MTTLIEIIHTNEFALGAMCGFMGTLGGLICLGLSYDDKQREEIKQLERALTIAELNAKLKTYAPTVEPKE